MNTESGIPKHFAAGREVEISAFAPTKEKDEKDEEIRKLDFTRKFNKECSKRKYDKPIPACPTCKVTNEAFGFKDMFEGEDDTKESNEEVVDLSGQGNTLL